MVSRRIRLRTCKQLFDFCVAIAVILLPWWRAELTRGNDPNLNLPLPLGTRWETFSAALTRALVTAQRFSPDALIVSLGVDTYKDDPISGFSLETADFIRMAETIRDAGLPTLVVLEGGYNLKKIGENVVAFLQGLEPHHE